MKGILFPSRFLVGCTILAGAFGSVRADEATPYRFFVGVDVMIPHADDFVEVANFQDERALIQATEAPASVPIKDIGAFRWHRHPKVSPSLVNIENFASDRVTSLNSDTKLGWMVTQNHMAIYSQERSAMQLNEMNREEVNAQFAVGGALEAPYGAEGRTASEIMSKAIGDYEAVAAVAESMTNPATWGQLEGNDAGEDTSDTLEVTFTISSIAPVAGAYAVVLADIASEAQNGTVTLFEELGDLTPNPRKITIRRPFLSPGFKVENVRIHVYAHGIELGTNLSDRPRGLTRQQARDYLLLVHLTDHKEGNILPVPVWELAPPALFAEKDRQRFDFPVAVSVGPDGEVIAVHRGTREALADLKVYDVADLNTKSTPSLPEPASGAGGRPKPPTTLEAVVPAEVDALVRQCVFLPALQNGKPVKGIVTVNLADFFPAGT